jgi:hypothetical protein
MTRSRLSQSMVDFQCFVTDYLTVLDGLASGAAKPWVSDPVLNAYDLRPRDALREPGRERLRVALKAFGFPQEGDIGIANLRSVERLQSFVKPRQGIVELMHLVVAFMIYRELCSGRKMKWKILR